MQRVVITGLGAVCALGNEVPSLWAAVTAGKVGIGPIANISAERLNVKIAAEVKNFDAADYFDRRRAPMLDRSSQFALVAAREAIADAGVAFGAGARAGVILGATGGWATVDDSYEQFYGRGSNRLHPLTIPRIMANAPVSQITMEHGIRGPAFTISSACASANHAIGIAFHLVRSGALEAAVTGGSDASIMPGFLKGWDALRVLSADTCRPFSKNRSGLVIGEGAGVLVIESLAAAAARGARIYAEIVGFGMNADGKDITAPDEASAAAAMGEALKDAGLPPQAVQYVNAHGTGTWLNDRTESAALHQTFGAHAADLWVSSTKSMFGHNLAAAGALEMIVTALALQEGVVPPTMNIEEPDPECDLDYVP
ncbi:MAG: beta-ketoacyl-[acyl-carrier-protein] synthase family protein, partial [Alphaproteobacteria bacterium]|nr:beta-ketoacyl-[acyl-carrier-protein] synthase family protein [Alphaproteobacteria bacterium]